MITKFFLFILLLVAVVLVTAYFLPRDFRLSKTVTIEASRENIYNYVRYLENQDQYSVWVMADPGIQITFSGKDGEIGGSNAWTSQMKNVGVGSQIITALVPNEKITVEIHFEKPFKAINYSDTILTEVEWKTQVTNTFYGTSNFPMNITNLFLEKMVGKDMQQNLNNLKKILEQK